VRPPYLPHSAFAEERDDFVRTDARASTDRHQLIILCTTLPSTTRMEALRCVSTDRSVLSASVLSRPRLTNAPYAPLASRWHSADGPRTARIIASPNAPVNESPRLRLAADDRRVFDERDQLETTRAPRTRENVEAVASLHQFRPRPVRARRGRGQVRWLPLSRTAAPDDRCFSWRGGPSLPYFRSTARRRSAKILSDCSPASNAS
jgi:hypothetical protein